MSEIFLLPPADLHIFSNLKCIKLENNTLSEIPARANCWDWKHSHVTVHLLVTSYPECPKVIYRYITPCSCCFSLQKLEQNAWPDECKNFLLAQSYPHSRTTEVLFHWGEIWSCRCKGFTAPCAHCYRVWPILIWISWPWGILWEV